MEGKKELIKLHFPQSLKEYSAWGLGTPELPWHGAITGNVKNVEMNPNIYIYVLFCCDFLVSC